MSAMEDLDKRSKELMDYLIMVGALKSKSIIEAFKEVPRHHFVLSGYQHYAYDDVALPIVKSATITQPSTVAIMLEYLHAKRGDRVLEIGMGSGWQACLLSRIVSDSGKVVTIEIDEEVFKFGKANIEKMKMKNIKMAHGDGSAGYAEEAPYDKIIYTAAAPDVSLQVLKQLKIGGRVVAPVGSTMLQKMVVVDKTSTTKMEKREFGTFQFVPLKGKLGF